MNRPKHLTERAKRLRKEATWPEKILWSRLRRGQLHGFKFRRQHSVLGHILDFACIEAKVAVEVDGASHQQERESTDERKEQVLHGNGWEILRFSNRDVYRHLEGVLNHICDTCSRRLEEET